MEAPVEYHSESEYEEEEHVEYVESEDDHYAEG